MGKGRNERRQFYVCYSALVSVLFVRSSSRLSFGLFLALVELQRAVFEIIVKDNVRIVFMFMLFCMRFSTFFVIGL